MGLSPRMSMLLLPPSRPSVPSNLWIGVPLASKLVSITNLQLLSLVVILPRFNVPSACCPTPLPLLRLGLVLIIILILCMPTVPLSIGTSEKVWKKENSLKPVKIWLLLRRITKKLVLTLLKPKVKKAKNTNEKKYFPFKKRTHAALTEENFLIIGLTIVCKTILTCLCIF